VGEELNHAKATIKQALRDHPQAIASQLPTTK